MVVHAHNPSNYTEKDGLQVWGQPEIQYKTPSQKLRVNKKKKTLH